MSAGCDLAVRGGRQGDKKRGSDPRRRLEPDLAAVPLDHAAHQGQADAFPLRHVRMQPIKGGEHSLMICLGDAQAIVLDIINMEARLSCLRAPTRHNLLQSFPACPDRGNGRHY